MTTITIERELLEQALDALSAPNHRVLRESPICVGIRAALSAPATAPAQPEIVDLLAEMYELILANKVVLAEKSGGVWTWPDRAIEAVRKHRSGPAQPERKPTTDAQCIELFHKVQRGMGFKDHDVIPFISGVAAGEHFHGIKETP